MADFLNMGGYGGFIWPAFIIVFGVLITLGISSFNAQKNLANEAKMLKEKRRSLMEGKT